MMADNVAWQAMWARAAGAEDVFAETLKLIADHREENALNGGDDRQLGILMYGLIAQIALPVLPAKKAGSL